VGTGRTGRAEPALSRASRCRFTSTARSSGSIALWHSTQGISSSCSVGGRYGCQSHHSVHRRHTHPSGRPRLTGSGRRRNSGGGGGGGAQATPRNTRRLGCSPAGDDVAGGLSVAEPWEVAGVSELFFVSFSSMETALVSTIGRESRAESHGSSARLLVHGT